MSFDSASDARLQLLYPDFAVRVIRTLEDIRRVTGKQMRVSEGIRSFARQAEDYDKGRTKPGPHASPAKPMGLPVTNARPGYSYHAYGLATDNVFQGDDPYLEIMAKKDPKGAEEIWETYARIAEAYGLVSGRRFPRVDSTHIEAKYGSLRIQDYLDLYLRGGVAAIWATIDEIRGVPEGQAWNSIIAGRTLSSLDSIARNQKGAYPEHTLT
jgi:hypothetical protein